MGWSDWFGGSKTGVSTGEDKSNNTKYVKNHKLEGNDDSHDHSWSRTDTYPSGATRTVMSETGRNSVARDGRSADRGPSNRDNDRERR